ncbi:hypothetical protein SAMN05446635_2843 [Burkholderia sp. OK233]|nr:hypothetical protein SAMN05446635_2843 [Burkholderia sp. OK233]
MKTIALESTIACPVYGHLKGATMSTCTYGAWVPVI